MNAIAPLLAVLAALTLPATAGAKGLATVEVCGPHDCFRPESGELAGRVATVQETVDQPATAPYYRIEIAFRTGASRDAYSTYFVPEHGLIATNAAGLLWYVPPRDALQSLTSATRGVEAYRAPPAWPRYIGPVPARASGPSAPPSRTPFALGALAVLVATAVVVARGIRSRRPAAA